MNTRKLMNVQASYLTRSHFYLFDVIWVIFIRTYGTPSTWCASCSCSMLWSSCHRASSCRVWCSDACVGGLWNYTSTFAICRRCCTCRRPCPACEGQFERSIRWSIEQGSQASPPRESNKELAPRFPLLLVGQIHLECLSKLRCLCWNWSDLFWN